jgi:hypothetical protein
MRTRKNARDKKLREAERRFRAAPTDENYRAYAKAALRAGDPLVRFDVVRGGAAGGPRDPDGSCVWVALSVSGRAVGPGAGVEDEESVRANLAQIPASQEIVAQMIVDAMNKFEPAQLERWTARPEVNRVLRISSGDYIRRVHRSAREGASFPELYQAAGFTVGHTGGGCTAWILESPTNHVLVTGGDATVPEADDEEIVVGLYDNEGEWIEEAGDEFPNTHAGAQAAIALARRLIGL